MLIPDLKKRWENLLKEKEISSTNRENLFNEIISAYQEPHRFFHNLNHINQFFQELDTCYLFTDKMQWALWYHDIVYQPGAKDNEKKSAEKAEMTLCNLNFPEQKIVKIVELILATENHQGGTSDIETQLFLDADMAILGSNRNKYLNYCQAIRKEYSLISDDDFNRGRKQFLSKLLKQKSIFSSSCFREKYEQFARINIEAEFDAAD